jgi:hypothetical protein
MLRKRPALASAISVFILSSCVCIQMPVFAAATLTKPMTTTKAQTTPAQTKNTTTPAKPDTNTANKKAAQPAAASSKKNKSLLNVAKPVLDESTKKEIEAAGAKLDPTTKASVNKMADILHQQDQIINNELRDEETEAFANIGMLWSAAVERSGTIRYAIEKLSRRDATGKPAANDTFSKRMLQSLVHLGGVAGTMWTGTPAGMIGSNMVSGMMSGNPQDSALSQVTDADMVILAKEVDNLQTRLITLYYNYRHAQERLTLRRDASSIVTQYYDHALKSPDSNTTSLQPLMQSMEESARHEEESAQQAVSSARSELVMLVGEEALQALDNKQSEQASEKGVTTSATKTDSIP